MRIALRRYAFVLLLFATRHAEALPVSCLQMLGQKDDLAAVVRIVRDLPVDGLHHGMRFTADGDGAARGLRRSAAPVR